MIGEQLYSFDRARPRPHPMYFVGPADLDLVLTWDSVRAWHRRVSTLTGLIARATFARRRPTAF
jgi:hypothetical protein